MNNRRFSGLLIFKIDKVDFGFELNYANGWKKVVT